MDGMGVINIVSFPWPHPSFKILPNKILPQRPKNFAAYSVKVGIELEKATMKPRPVRFPPLTGPCNPLLGPFSVGIFCHLLVNECSSRYAPASQNFEAVFLLFFRAAPPGIIPSRRSWKNHPQCVHNTSAQNCWNPKISTSPTSQYSIWCVQTTLILEPMGIFCSCMDGGGHPKKWEVLVWGSCN